MQRFPNLKTATAKNAMKANIINEYNKHKFIFILIKFAQ